MAAHEDAAAPALPAWPRGRLRSHTDGVWRRPASLGLLLPCCGAAATLLILWMQPGLSLDLRLFFFFYNPVIPSRKTPTGQIPAQSTKFVQRFFFYNRAKAM